MLLTENEARAICEKLLSYVKADDATVGVGSENYGHLRFASNAFTTSGARENVNVGVTVWIDKKRRAASTNEIDDESLKVHVAPPRALPTRRLAQSDCPAPRTLRAQLPRGSRKHADVNPPDLKACERLRRRHVKHLRHG